ncbi:MAG: zinc-binding dehydrogenase [Bryobacter sp.]
MAHLPQTYTAALFEGPRQPLRLVERALPALGAGETLVRVGAATLCASDLHSFHGRRSAPVPSVLGHEVMGEVLATRAAGVTPGQRITWSMVVACGTCERCQRGIPQKCERLFKYGHEAVEDGRAPSGGFADLLILRAGTPVFPVPAELPATLAATANCAGATVAALLRVAGLSAAPDRAGNRVLVLGAGMLGLTACAMAHAFGAQVCLYDPDPQRAEKAIALGARVLEAGELAEDKFATFDAALEFSGHPDAFPLGLRALGIGGRLVLAGAVYPTPPASTDMERIVRRLLRIEGVHNYRPADLATALDFLAQAHTRYPLAALVEKEFPLSAINEAFAYATNERPVRVAIVAAK